MAKKRYIIQTRNPIKGKKVNRTYHDQIEDAIERAKRYVSESNLDPSYIFIFDRQSGTTTSLSDFDKSSITNEGYKVIIREQRIWLDHSTYMNSAAAELVAKELAKTHQFVYVTYNNGVVWWRSY